MPEQRSSSDVAAAARSRGAHVHTVQGRVVDKASAYEAIAAAMTFPAHFGHNLDALYDCLTDLTWLPIGEHVLIWAGSQQLQDADPKAYLAIRSVLSDAQRALGPAGQLRDSRQLTVELTES